jgi:hypothetical protein
LGAVLTLEGIGSPKEITAAGNLKAAGKGEEERRREEEKVRTGS